jgi:hypothetical protein
MNPIAPRKIGKIYRGTQIIIPTLIIGKRISPAEKLLAPIAEVLKKISIITMSGITMKSNTVKTA